MVKFITLVALVIIGATPFAHAAECVKTPDEIRALYHSHPKFSHYMPGHRGEKCWYAEGHKITSERKHTNRVTAAETPQPRAGEGAKVLAVPSPVSPLEEARALFPDHTDLTFEERAIAERLVDHGWELWLKQSPVRIEEHRNQARRELLREGIRRQALATQVQ